MGSLEASWKPSGSLRTSWEPSGPLEGVLEGSWEALDYQEAPKEPRKRAKDGPRGSQEALFSTTPWERCKLLLGSAAFVRT